MRKLQSEEIRRRYKQGVEDLEEPGRLYLIGKLRHKKSPKRFHFMENQGDPCLQRGIAWEGVKLQKFDFFVTYHVC